MIRFRSNGPPPPPATISDLDDPPPPPTRSLYIIYNSYTQKKKKKKFPLPKNQSFLQIVEAEAETLDFLLQAPSLYIWGMKIEPSNLWC